MNVNPLYSMYGPGQPLPQQQPAFNSPMDRMQAMMAAMQNPAEFVRRLLPNMPKEISNDPNKVAQYLIQNGYSTPYDYQQAAMQVPPGYMR